VREARGRGRRGLLKEGIGFIERWGKEGGRVGRGGGWG